MIYGSFIHCLAAHRPSHSFLSPPSDMKVGGQVMGRLWSSQAFTFVADHTPVTEEGLLPGLCLYTELWLAKVRLLCVCACVCAWMGIRAT